ncbi:MAG: NAD(P)H-hydrate dehydratase [Prevotella sp.]|nr:NAD(P)H-hydrate dehydratase [Prevotella sp.]
MKIFTAAQIRELDKYTIEHEPIRSIDLMERAANALTQAVMDEWTNLTPVVVFAGPGNNGGDALAMARLLAEADYQVSVYLFNIHNKLSEDCAANKQRLLDTKKLGKFTEITVNFDPPELTADTLVVDGLFGSGINKPLNGGFASLVKYINQSPAKVVSVDVPSGLMCEDNTYNIRQNIVHADLTLTLQQKKLSMLFADCQCYIGRLRVIDIRLSHEYIANTEVSYRILEEKDLRSRLRPRGDFAHKGSMGHALLVAGSYGMAGAAVLATKACLRSGPGKVTVHTPKRNYGIMQATVPEAVMQMDHEETIFSESVDSTDFDALGIGPGLGQNENTAIALIGQIRRTQCPVVVDADAINILGSHQAWIQQLPKGIILTPHPKEFDRLINTNSNGDYERLTHAQQLAERLNGYVLLKGHYSALCMPDGHVVFNSTGNSGMATAGSGDVLTGIITGLLARGYDTPDACMLGMYLHGLAGDLAAKDLGKESLVASDIIDYLPQAFKRLED